MKAGIENIPNNQPGTLISADQITVKKGKKTLLESVSLSVGPNEIVTLIGPNGAGKTTLLRTFLGVVIPTGGTIHRRADLRIGYVPQRIHVEPVLPLSADRFIRLDWRGAKEKYEEIISLTGVGPLRERMLYEISGGELQRVTLARALMREPNLLLLDEPVQGVDRPGQLEIYELISQLRMKQGMGVLLVSHDLHLVMSQSTRVICLEQHICCSGHPESVLADPAYLRLFGPRVASHLAVYTHSHSNTSP